VINLFEYQNKVELSDSFSDLEQFLDEVWSNREKSAFYLDDEENRIEVQRFIQFFHKTKEIKSNKYVGVIHFEGKRVNLLPKVFFGKESYSEANVNQIHNHVLWWLSYCRKIKFPNYQTSLGGVKSDFFEVLIFLFAKYTRQLLTNSIYQQYEEINSELPYIKGRINTNEYINQNISKGNWHKLNCTYDAFVMDNRFNQIIKYVTKLLISVTSSNDSKKQLREILFILDEVRDVKVSAEECLAVRFNPLFGEFETVRDYCYLFLSNCISFDYKNDLKLFAFLLPMEYVFEDFIFGFIDKEIEKVSAKSQMNSKHLDLDKNFALRPDLLLQLESGKRLIADAKYKIIYSNDNDPKKGVSQSDLYQMLAYAVRFDITEIILFYPNMLVEADEQESEIIIEDTLANNKKVTIRSIQLPVIDREVYSNIFASNRSLNDIFEQTKTELKLKIESILVGKR